MAKPTSGNTRLIFDVGRRHWRIRFLQVASLVFAAALVSIALDLISEAEAAGGSLWLATLGSVLTVALAAGWVGATFLYAARYVTRIERDSRIVRVWTLSPLFGSRLLSGPEREASTGVRRPGHTTGRHTPWRSLRIPGYRVPFILDLRAPTIDEGAIRSLRGRPDRA